MDIAHTHTTNLPQVKIHKLSEGAKFIDYIYKVYRTRNT